MTMGIECVPVMESPGRVFDASTQYFPDYGYKSPQGLIRALRESFKSHELKNDKTPHVVIVTGKPKAGKMHAVWDIANRLSKPADIVLWGYCFSIAKHKGKIPPKKYGEFGDESINAVTDELQELTYRAVKDRQGENALIFVKAPATTGAEIKGEFFGRNRGYTALKALAKREGQFNNLDYKLYCAAEVAEPSAETQGNRVRPELEKVVDKPTEIAGILEASGEVILTCQGAITREDQETILDYVLESANPEASTEIRFLTNNLAVEMTKRGRFRLNPESYYWDEEYSAYAFYNPLEEMEATALTLREILENNLGITRRVFLGRNGPLSEIAADLRIPIRNVAKAYYPDIRDIRNK